MFKPVSPRINFAELEKDILTFWYKEGIVDRYLRRNAKAKKRFSFLDGPITANNPMGIHHAWGRTYKDLWQRFYAMRGYRQRFQNGFDCQGLWVEVEVEKELGIKNKKEIENLIPGDKKASIEKFVKLCKKRVDKYSAMQTKQSKRLGCFMDWQNSYYTMSDENNYMIWHFLKTCHERDWIYKGEDSVPWCPRCQTAISQHEILTEDYKEIAHQTVFVKLPVLDRDFSLIIWTTTPWTIPANVAVAVNPEFSYQIWQDKKSGQKILTVDPGEIENEEKRLFLEDLLKDNFKKVKVLSISGDKLVGLKYQGPYDDLAQVIEVQKENPQTFHTIIAAQDLVVAAKGTGILHVATGAGTEDFRLGRQKDLPVLSVIDESGSYLEGMGFLTRKNAKAQPEIILDDLKEKRGKFFLRSQKITHRYPVCWRCKEELVWRVTDEWYIAMDQKSKVKSQKSDNKNPKSENETLRERMIRVAKEIHWIPEFGLERELDWLKNMEDWLISKKNRYWGLALPIWECGKCGYFEVIGSKEELKEKAVVGWEEFVGKSPHKPQIDAIKIRCLRCHALVSRIEPVGNPWLDAGIVPYSTITEKNRGKPLYLENKKKWRRWFPADFITESFPGQFKNWFYSLIAMSTVLEGKPPFKMVLGFATLLGEDGRPMHKSWGNAIEFNEGADKIGVDVMRWMYLAHDPRLNLLFGYTKADETRRRFHLLLWNVYNFFVAYANVDKFQISNFKFQIDKLSILDRWIISRLHQTIKTVTKSLEVYDAFAATGIIEELVSDLSRWYVRRSRERVGPTAKNKEDKDSCYRTLYQVLITLIQLLAPFTPFLAEEIYQNLTGEVSIHLSNWPESDRTQLTSRQSKVLLEKMRLVRRICELGHAQRKKMSINVRQPLNKLQITNYKLQITGDLENLIMDEVNVKKVVWVRGDGELTVTLDKRITPELKAEGEAREMIRKIQILRKEAGCKLDEKVIIQAPSWPEAFVKEIKAKTLTKRLVWGKKLRVLRD